LARRPLGERTKEPHFKKIIKESGSRKKERRAKQEIANNKIGKGKNNLRKEENDERLTSGGGGISETTFL